MKLNWNNRQLTFEHVDLCFEDKTFINIFQGKNNKTLQQTLLHPRYSKLSKEVMVRYSDALNRPLGEFLFSLKENGDEFYKTFLNKYGDFVYSRFWIEDAKVLSSKGLYLYTVGGNIHYIGRCKDTFNKRINQGYGVIHPKNCYVDGQATNCHINALITQCRKDISLLVCLLDTDQTIVGAETSLIGEYKPIWNMQGI